MQARMKNVVAVVPDALRALHALSKASQHGGVPARTLELIHLRVSQINGCGVCLDMHAKAAAQAGESAERIASVAAWRDTPYFSDAERAALALTEAATRLADRGEAVPDDVWDAAAEHFDETQLGALVLDIGLINLWNRLNVTTRQVAGEF